MKVRVDGTLGHAVAEYTGTRVIELDVIPDPHVEGAYAMQAILDDARVHCLQFMVRDIELRKVTAEDLEEVEFTTWPPEVK